MPVLQLPRLGDLDPLIGAPVLLVLFGHVPFLDVRPGPPVEAQGPAGRIGAKKSGTPNTGGSESPGARPGRENGIGRLGRRQVFAGQSRARSEALRAE